MFESNFLDAQARKHIQPYVWRWDNPERAQEIAYYSYIKTHYGISKSEYIKMREAQNNKCAICSGDPPKHHAVLSADHNHNTMRFRGLLCNDCNNGLGRFKDNLNLLRKAAVYLEETDE